MSQPSAPDLERRLARLSPAKRELLERKLRERGAATRAEESIPRLADRRRCEVSFAQQRLYFLNRLEPESAAYNVPRAIRLRGRLDVSALERAFEELLRRHESLRTRFRERDGTIFAEVLPAADFSLPVMDLAESSDAAAREREALRRAEEEGDRPFDLGQGPIVRATLLRLTPRDHILLLTMHHVASDAWSAGILFDELGALYAAYSAGRPSPLAEPPIQYSDFAAWQRRWLSGDVLNDQLSYWREQLRAVPPLDLPTDHPRPVHPSGKGAVETAVFPVELVEKLRELCRREGVTLFMGLVAIFQTLLFRYTEQEDVAVGTPIANRNRPEIEGLIGFFVNTLVLRTRLAADLTFRDLLARVRETALGAYAHQDLPFEKLVEELQPGRDLHRNPLFQTMLALRNTPSTAVEFTGLAVEQLNLRQTTSKFDLSVFFNETSGGLVCAVEYSTDLFDPPTIGRLIEHLRTLIASATADPSLPLADLAVLTAPERHQLLVEWNETNAPFPAERSLHELFDEQVDKNPDALAVRDETEALSYRELQRRANQLAHLLRRRGIRPEEVVGVCLPRSARTIVALLGALKAGGAYLPLDPSYPPERLAFMLADSGARVVVTERGSASRVAGHAGETLLLDFAALAPEPEASPVTGVRPENLAYLIYTSGSTGVPKGVEAVHRASVNRFAWMWRTYPFEPGEVCCQKTALSFVDSVWEIFGPLLQGVSSVVLSDEQVRDPRAFIDALSFATVTRIVLVPSLLRALLDSGVDLSARLPALKWWITSGEALSLELYRRFRSAMPAAILLNLYGSSEVSADVTCYDSRSEAVRDAVPIGRPIANTRLYVLDQRRRPVPMGVPGELFVGGAGLARGYRNRAELTAERFVQDPFSRSEEARVFRTGDRVRYLADGQIEFLGRRDYQVKLRGHRIELGEIESALASHPAVDRAVVLLREDSPGEPRLTAYVVPKEAPATVQELRRFLDARLPEFMLPSAFVFLESIPLTPSGKTDRNALPPPDAARPQLDVPFVEPRTSTERALVDIWTGALNMDRVGVEDDFFDLGGHSLLVLQIAARIRASLGVDLPLRAFFESPTIARLAARVDEAASREPSAEQSIVARAAEDVPLPLSFAQQRLWVLDQVEPGDSAYLIRRAYRLTGPLDAEKLRRSFDGVAARHASLRTSFFSIDGVPHQRIATTTRVPFEEVDLSAVPAPHREAEIERRISDEGVRPFDLTREPLLRCVLLRIGPDEHVLLLTLHHIVADAWSLTILVREVSALYAERSALPALPIQYPDYALWQRTRLTKDVVARELSYWRNELEGAPEELELLANRPRPPRRSSRGGRRPVACSPPVTSALQSIGRRSGATLYMTLAAAFATLLSRYTRHRDVLIGSPVAGRELVETESLIGLFVNTVVLRARLAGDPSFSELLARVREATLGALAHRELPFEKVVEELRPARTLSRNPIFQVWFVLQNAPGASLELPGVRVAHLEPWTVNARHDLQLTMWESAAGLSGSLDFSTDLFENGRIDQVAAELTLLLKLVAADPDARLSALQLKLDEALVLLKAPEQARLDEAGARSLKIAKRKAVRR